MTGFANDNDRDESERDQLESSFTPVLRRVFRADAAVLAVGFVDTLGECVDYCSSIPPFETKVTAAHLAILFEQLHSSASKHSQGEPRALHVRGAQRDLLARRVTDDYLLTVAIVGRQTSRRIEEAVERACTELRAEMAVPVPSWDVAVQALRVETRVDELGFEIPVRFHERGIRRAVSAVLGRWGEFDQGQRPRSYFRIRTFGGEELNLWQDLGSGVWGAER